MNVTPVFTIYHSSISGTSVHHYNPAAAANQWGYATGASTMTSTMGVQNNGGQSTNGGSTPNRTSGVQDKTKKYDKDGWICGKCGNYNYGDHVVCNMRICRAPRDPEVRQKLLGGWVCRGCGNYNYNRHQKCNMRICGLPRTDRCRTIDQLDEVQKQVEEVLKASNIRQKVEKFNAVRRDVPSQATLQNQR